MIPGFMCDDRLFEPQIRAFGQSHDVRVICADATATSIASMAHGVLTQAPCSFTLMGLSMGGIVAMEITRVAAERVGRLALFDCNPMPDSAKSSAERKRQINLVRSGRLLEVMRTDHIPKYFAEGAQDNEIAQLCQDMAETRGANAFINHQHALIARPDQYGSLKEIKVPTLIACGAQDQLCPLSKHELMLGAIPNASLRVIPDAGHLPTLEQPEKTNQIIEAWLHD